MPIIKFYIGDKGPAGINGIDGLGVADVHTDKLDSPVFDVLKVNKLSESGSIKFNRNSIASQLNRNNKNVWANNIATTNYIPFSEDFSQWDDTGFNSWSWRR